MLPLGVLHLEASAPRADLPREDDALAVGYLADDVGHVEPGHPEGARAILEDGFGPADAATEAHLPDRKDARDDGLRRARGLEVGDAADVGEVVEAAWEEGDGVAGRLDTEFPKLRGGGFADSGEAREGGFEVKGGGGEWGGITGWADVCGCAVAPAPWRSRLRRASPGGEVDDLGRGRLAEGTDGGAQPPFALGLGERAIAAVREGTDTRLEGVARAEKSILGHLDEHPVEATDDGPVVAAASKLDLEDAAEAGGVRERGRHQDSRRTVQTPSALGPV
jgi:hypothetical protein